MTGVDRRELLRALADHGVELHPPEPVNHELIPEGEQIPET